MDIRDKKYLNRIVLEKKSFKKEGTFRSYYEAIAWVIEKGYKHGSSDRGGIIAIQKGEYNLPQKWYNISTAYQKKVDGVMLSTDFREGEVTVILY